jgi:hypothetical protein
MQVLVERSVSCSELEEERAMASWMSDAHIYSVMLQEVLKILMMT